MKIEIDRQNKIVEIWLTNQKQQNAAVMESITDYYRQYQAKNKYKVAVSFR
ncbi:MAG: hypothetical protein ACLTBZ_10935 [Faecalispora jeddahensis]|uniref:hypothetical protein n=1 Tax=Eubacteriales TaxID=186802 RepID=UPI00026F43F7|nr:MULTISPECIES: hypothetical protein [Eubacteriales]EJF41045.1 hypothetical protein HMPREF1141_3314 [Clostridium sp. MSTE9]